MAAERAIFVGLVRDSAPFLPAVLGNIERMAATFENSAFLFLESGSRDNTRALLEDWCRGGGDASVLASDSAGASSPHRTVRIASLRNQLVAAVRARFPDFDLLVVVDCDDVNATPVTDMTGFSRAVDFLQSDESHAAVFANSSGAYYDMWALRHAMRCPDDIWEATMDYALGHGVSDDRAFDEVFKPRLFALEADAPPMEVESAFGGLGIYRLARVLDNAATYEGHKVKPVAMAAGLKKFGWQRCEHVAFHAGLRAQGGRLFVLPWLVIRHVEKGVFPPADCWRALGFEMDDLLAAPQAPLVPQAPLPPNKSRNEPCHCGSGRRYKHCHGNLG